MNSIKEFPDIEDNDCWNSIFQAVLKHHVEPYFYFQFKNRFKELAVPDFFIKNLQQRYYTVATYNTRLYHELIGIIRLLHKNQINVIVLKGAYLASVIYENQSLRPMTDLDLLIKKEDIEKAVKSLAEIEYVPHKQYSQEALDETQIHLPALVKPGKNDQVPDTFVELHWSILRPKINRSIDVEKLWLRAEKFSLNYLDVLSLSPEDNLHHLAIHTAFDDLLGNGILPLLDIKKLIDARREEINWDSLYEITKTAGTERYTLLILCLAKELLGAKIDEQFFKQLGAEQLPPEILEFAKERILHPNDSSSSQAEIIGRTLAGSGSTKVRGFLRKIFPTQSELSEIYGVSPGTFAIWIYYPVRWKDVFKRYIVVLCQMIFGDPELKKAAKSGTRGRKLADWLAS